MRVLGIVPARDGSVRLPKKNMQRIEGLTLVDRAVICARQCKSIHRVAVSTNIPEVLNQEQSWNKDGRVFILTRHPSLCGDDVPMLPVVHDVLSILKDVGELFDVTVLLQPTSPLRNPYDVDRCIEIMRDVKADSVVSVVQCDKDLAFQVRRARRLERLPNVVMANGAVYVLTTDALDRGEDWFSGLAYAYEMPKDRSLDVDTAFDLACARLALEQREKV